MAPLACIAIVTGANRLNGLGIACVRQLAFQYPSSKFNSGGPFLIYLTARSKESGEAAVEAVTQQIQEAAARGKRDEGSSSSSTTTTTQIDVKLRLLDIENEKSIAAFTASLVADHPDGIDILINNSGILGDPSSTTPEEEEEAVAAAAARVMRCNYFGTLALTQALLPHIRDGGRVVSLSSFSSALTIGEHKMYSPEVRRRFIEAATVEDVSGLAKEYIEAVQRGDWMGDWPPSAYAISKAAVNGMSRVLAQQVAKSGRKILINSCCPGFVITDMYDGKAGARFDPRPPKTPDQGATTPVLLALGEIDGQSGLLWRDEKVTEWK